MMGGMSIYIRRIAVGVLSLTMLLSVPAVSAAQTDEEVPEVIQSTLTVGMTNWEVAVTQALLSAVADVYPEGLITGYFGELTRRAVMRFQNLLGLDPVGVVGPQTRSALNSMIVAAAKEAKNKGNGQEKENQGKSDEAPGADHRAEPATPATPNQGNGPATPATPATPAHKAGGSGGGGSDTTGPELTGVSATLITTDSAVIEWQSNELSTGVVLYNTEPSTDGAVTLADTTFRTLHSLAVSGLTAATTYHYRISSTDTFNNTTVLDFASFTTLPEPDATTTPPEPDPGPGPGPGPSPEPDTAGPWITALSITPTSIVAGDAVTFTVTADDPDGVSNVIYDVRYPDGLYFLRPNCNFLGATSTTCSFSQTIDHAIVPTEYGDYTIVSVRASDTKGTVATYFPNGTVTGGREATHSLTIPPIRVSQSGGATTTPSTKFSVGNRVYTTDNLNVRSLPSLSSTSLGVAPAGTQGTVIGGPVSAVGFNWWQIDYDSGADGWSVENYLELVP